MAFDGCSLLTTITIKSAVLANIGSFAFRNCSSLSEIFIPSTVTQIGECAFNGCSSLTINIAASEVPSTWDPNWNVDNRPVNKDVKFEGKYVHV